MNVPIEVQRTLLRKIFPKWKVEYDGVFVALTFGDTTFHCTGDLNVWDTSIRDKTDGQCLAGVLLRYIYEHRPVWQPISHIEGLARCVNKLIADVEQAIVEHKRRLSEVNIEERVVALENEVYDTAASFQRIGALGREIRPRLEALGTPKPKPEPEPEPEKTWKNEALGAIVAQALPVYSLYLLGCDVSGVRFEFDKRKFLVDPHLCVKEIFEPPLLWTPQAALIEQTIKYAAQSEGEYE